MPIHQITFQEFTTQSPAIFERVAKNHEIISVEKEPEQAIVILDAQEYNSLIETLYLLSNQANSGSTKESPTNTEASIENIFGIAKSNRAVSLDDMEAAIRNRGGQL
jgi:antitoxin YefM